MKHLIFLVALLALLYSSFFLFNKESETDLFASYKLKYNKNYSSEQEEYRRSVFLENLAQIEAHNATPGITHTEGINQFTDITTEEFESTYLVRIDQEELENYYPKYQEINYISSQTNDIDWGAKGSIVKNQGSCGSCWAFSTVATLESWNLIFGTKSQVLYSEQQLVDCSRNYGNNGCGGGMPFKALNYVKDKGIVTSSEYPYVARDQQCKKDGGPFKIAGQSNPSGCSQLESSLNTQPISVCVNASNWSRYSGGVFKDCATNINHAVLLTGKVGGAWKIKNSWGTGWGEQGYIRLADGNTCGVCQYNAYPRK